MASMPQLKTGSDYQNFALMKFWDSYSRYHPTDMLEIAVSIITSLKDKDKKQKIHKDKYLKELKLYYTSMSSALIYWYKRMGLKLACPFDLGCLELIHLVRYSRKPVILNEITDEKYSKYEVEIYFKHMKAHILDIMMKTSEFFSFDISNLSESEMGNLPPEIIKR